MAYSLHPIAHFFVTFCMPYTRVTRTNINQKFVIKTVFFPPTLDDVKKKNQKTEIKYQATRLTLEYSLEKTITLKNP